MLIECLLLYLFRIDIVNEGEELSEGVTCQTLPACNLYQFRCYINRSVRAITITNDKSCGIGRVKITARISGGSTEGEFLVRLPLQGNSPSCESFSNPCNLFIVIVRITYNDIHFFRFEFRLFNNVHNIIYTIEKYNTFFRINPFPINIHRRIIAVLVIANYFQCCIDRILCAFSIYSNNILFFPVKLIVIHILEVVNLFQIFVKNWSCR